jgi:sugar phosphate isomerase/epimerase
MKENRREFIKSVALVTAGALALPSFLTRCAGSRKLVGLQLWTLRDTIGKETQKTLESVSRIGYNNLEPYGFDGYLYGMTAKDFRKIVEDLGMRMTSTHTGVTVEEADRLFDEAAKVGLEYVVMASPGKRPMDTEEDFRLLAAELNKIGEKAQSRGIRFGYHNHANEFRMAGETVHYDVLLQYTDPDLVCFQADTYWMVKGGHNLADYINRYPGRFELWHIKDIGANGEDTDIGKGSIDFREIFSLKKKSGMKYFYVEQEAYAKSPMESIEEGYKYIKENLV